MYVWSGDKTGPPTASSLGPVLTAMKRTAIPIIACDRADHRLALPMAQLPDLCELRLLMY
jgi:hypothetical protein